MTRRLFVAVSVPAWVRGELDEQLTDVRVALPSLRWLDPRDWHITVCFVGRVNETSAGAVVAATHAVAAEMDPFEARLDGSLGTFGGRVLWAGIEAEDLADVAARMREELLGRGVEVEERPFRGHMTVARVPARGTRIPRASVQGWTGPTSSWSVEELEVLESKPSGRGTRYESYEVAVLGRGR